MVVETKLRDFIVGDLGWEGSPSTLTGEFPLLERGVLDSVGILQLVSYIESEFGVEIEDQELVADNFGTLAAIIRLIESKREG
jgi:acyl carrier protein